MLLIAPAVLAIAAWGGYVRARFGSASASVVEFAPPFVGSGDGVADALVRRTHRRNRERGSHSRRRLRRGRTSSPGGAPFCSSAALPYALLVPFLSEHVMLFTTNALRAFAPAFTFLWLELYRRKDLNRTAELDRGRSSPPLSARSE